MKILIVNASDIQGGAARAAYRLHRALLAKDIDSQMLVQNKTSDNFTVIGPTTKRQKALAKIRGILDSAPLKLYPKRTQTHFSISWAPSPSIINKINEINADVVHLHWINDGMIRVEDLTKIKAPIVWSLHDMWAFTGGCHYNEECLRYNENCGKCIVLGSLKEHDLSRRIWNRKQKSFSKVQNLTINGLSKWLENSAKNSSLFTDNDIVNLPNPINTATFKPINKGIARDLLGLPQGKKLVLFGALGATTDPRKGYKELVGAFFKLKRTDIELVVFGSDKPKNGQNLRFKTNYLGNLYDDVSMVALYSAADIMIVPSRQENLSNVIMESLACGTPVVAFDIGGNSDMIEHKQNGYLAKPYDTTDLANGMKWIMSYPNYDKLCQNAKEKVLKEFDSKVVVEKYIKLYWNILKPEFKL